MIRLKYQNSKNTEFQAEIAKLKLEKLKFEEEKQLFQAVIVNDKLIRGNGVNTDSNALGQKRQDSSKI